MSVTNKKCIVKGCENHMSQGFFIGDLCAPCHKFLESGIIGPTTSFLKDFCQLKFAELDDCGFTQAEQIQITKNWGWIYNTEVIFHPHNRDEIKTNTFKSPRMSSPRDYFDHTDLFESEARAFAYQVYDSNIKYEVIEVLMNYFKENNLTTTPPKLLITIKP